MSARLAIGHARPGRPRPPPRARRSRSPSGSAGRRRPTGRSGPARGGSGSARSSRAAVEKPAYWRIVQSRLRYIVGLDAAGERVLARAGRGRGPRRARRCPRACRGRRSRCRTWSRSARAARRLRLDGLRAAWSRRQRSPARIGRPSLAVTRSPRAGRRPRSSSAGADGDPLDRSPPAAPGARSASSSPRRRAAAGRPSTVSPGATAIADDHARDDRTDLGRARCARRRPAARRPAREARPRSRLDLDLEAPAVDDDLERARPSGRPAGGAGRAGSRAPMATSSGPGVRRVARPPPSVGSSRSPSGSSGPSTDERRSGEPPARGGPRTASRACVIAATVDRRLEARAGASAPSRHRRASARPRHRGLVPPLPASRPGSRRPGPAERRAAASRREPRRGAPARAAAVPVLVDPAGREVAGPERRVAGHEAVERQRRLDAADLGLVERPAQPVDRRVAVAGVDHDLGDQVVVLGRHAVARLDRRVDPDARAGRHRPAADPARRRREVAAGILGGDAHLDRVARRASRPRRPPRAPRPRAGGRRRGRAARGRCRARTRAP